MTREDTASLRIRSALRLNNLQGARRPRRHAPCVLPHWKEVGMASERRNSKRSRSDGNGSPRVRYAVVGLGWIAQSAVLPAFEQARKNSELVALVSDDETKLKA